MHVALVPLLVTVWSSLIFFLAIFTGVAASIVGMLIVAIIIGIICCTSYKTRHRKGKIEKENEVQNDGKG